MFFCHLSAIFRYNNKTIYQRDEADLITVTAPNTTEINMSLEPGGGISGRVTDPNGNGIQGISVNGWPAIDSQWRGFGVTTDSQGYYSIRQVFAPGDVKVKAQRWGFDPIEIWYDNKAGFNSADLVAVTSGNTTPNINFVVAAAAPPATGTISGKVTDGRNGLWESVYVYVYDENMSYINATSPGCTGEYSVSSLDPGNYKVWFYNYANTSTSEWYDDKADFTSADTISINGTSHINNIDAILGPGFPPTLQGMSNIYHLLLDNQ